MKTVWLLYILVTFNGDPKIETHEYNTENKCKEEKVRIIKEFHEVYDLNNIEIHCVKIIKSS